MSIQILISTMHQKGFKLLDKMNIQSDAIVINQCDRVGYESIKRGNSNVHWFSFNERGVGLSRNNALMRSTSDIMVFADDDVIYDEGFEVAVLDAFKDNPRADILFFNFESQNPNRPEYIIRKKHRVRRYNSLRYGAFRIAVRRESLLKSGVTFSLLFGGGARYLSGEDSLFIYKAIESGMKAYALPVRLGVVRQMDSTWFEGYTDRFWADKGALFKAISKPLSIVFILYFLSKNLRKLDDSRSTLSALRLLLRGALLYEE